MRQGGTWLPPAFIAGLIPAVILGVAVPSLVAVAAAYGLLGLPIMLYASRRRRRQLFIAKVRATGALPAPEPEQEHQRRAREFAAYERRRHEARLDERDAARSMERHRDEPIASPGTDPDQQSE